jgi:FMN-dependent NADH-azoreductase
MSKKILRLDNSVFGENGGSSRLSDALVQKLIASNPGASVVRRDLSANPLPHLSGAAVVAINTPAEQRTQEQNALANISDAAIEELFSADIVVIGVPMYNFGIPSTLKAWLDHVAKAGVTFRYTENGPEGLVKGKIVYVVTTRGGVHQGSPTDAITPYLNVMLKFLGMDDIRTLYAEGLSMEGKEEKFEHALAEIDSLIVN